MTVQRMIVEVVSRQQLKRFVDFPHSLYQNHPYYVPALRRSELATFTPADNPSYDHCDTKLYLAIRDGRVLGRIALILNHLEAEKTGKRWARFGWFDFVDDPEVSGALLTTAGQWAKSQSCSAIKGPYGFSNMDKAGMLIEGFDERATMAELYNHRYYPAHMETHGFTKLVDWKSFQALLPTTFPAKVEQMSSIIRERYRLSTYQAKGRADLLRIGYEVFELLNLTYRDLEGFIPLTRAQIKHQVESYMPLLHPDFVSIVLDADGRVAGFGITMPSFSKALQRSQGRLFPFGLLHLWRARRHNDAADLYLIGVRPDFQNKGITVLMFEKIIKTFMAWGIKKVETNPELESNRDVQNLWKGYDIRLHKRRRSYQMEL